MNLTIKEIASMASVSISTVSRVINNNYPVSAEVRRRVNDVINENNFSLNNNARSLRSNRSRLIAVAIPSIEHTPFMEMASGLREVVSNNDCTLVVVDSGSKNENEEKVLQNLMNYQIDGLVIAPSDKNGRYIKVLADKGLPIVIVDRQVDEILPNASSILWSDEKITKDVIQHFIDGGHKKIAAICTPLVYSVGKCRYDTYIKTLNDNGIFVPTFYHDNKNSNYQESYITAMKILTSKDRPTAFYCMAPFCAFGLIKAINELKIKVPEDVEMTVYGSFIQNEILPFKINTIEQDLYEVGRIAGNILFEMMEDSGKISNIIITPEIKYEK